jgi:hypothetical protein
MASCSRLATCQCPLVCALPRRILGPLRQRRLQNPLAVLVEEPADFDASNGSVEDVSSKRTLALNFAGRLMFVAGYALASVVDHDMAYLFGIQLLKLVVDASVIALLQFSPVAQLSVYLLCKPRYRLRCCSSSRSRREKTSLRQQQPM